MLDSILAFAQSNPIVVLALLWILYKQWQAKQPWPDFGGRITSLHSLAEWTALLKECEDTGKVVIVDAYALWCPPCKSAAPVFAKLSEEFSEASTVFAKFNTDEAKDLARQLNISVRRERGRRRSLARARAAAVLTTARPPCAPSVAPHAGHAHVQNLQGLQGGRRAARLAGRAEGQGAAEETRGHARQGGLRSPRSAERRKGAWSLDATARCLHLRRADFPRTHERAEDDRSVLLFSGFHSFAHVRRCRTRRTLVEAGILLGRSRA